MTLAGSTARSLPVEVATVANSTPRWEIPNRPAQDAPNVIVVVIDDMGWSDLGCFGSEISTPVIDSLAGAGVRMANFQVTPLCSPTRASLLTGMDHHKVGMRFLAVSDTGFGNSRGQLPADVTTIPSVLRQHGYGTYLVGKWHLAPESELTPAGPHTNWPLARGFERFYGFLGGASDQYIPELYRDNSPVSPSQGPDYHLSGDLVDQSIAYLSDHLAFRSKDPFFLQLALGATHAPFQAPAKFIDKYRDKYSDGWDSLRSDRLARQISLGLVPEGTQLTERDSDVPVWDDLGDDDRALAARTQEAYAGFLDHTDTQLGRLVQWLKKNGAIDNTLIAVFSDNGAAGDGGNLGTTNVIAPYNALALDPDQEMSGAEAIGDRDHPAHYAKGWAMAGNTPFRLYKQYVDLGGVRSPLVVHWPERLGGHRGQVRPQFSHVVDLAASILDAALEASPERNHLLDELDGRSMLGVLSDPHSTAPRETQLFEMVGHRAILHHGWKAVTTHVQGTPYSSDQWRLYDTTADFSERRDLALEHPQVLVDLIELWAVNAESQGMLPLDDRNLKQLIGSGSPGVRTRPTELVLQPGQSHLGFTTRLTGTDRDMTLRARLEEWRPGDAGVIVASGASYGGYCLYVQNDQLVFEHNFLGERITCAADRPLTTGSMHVGFRLRHKHGRSRQVTLTIDEDDVATEHIPVTSMQLAFYGLDVGHDPGSSVSRAYPGPFPFTANVLREVSIFYSEDPAEHASLALHAEMNQ